MRMEDDVRQAGADRYAVSQAYRWRAERDKAMQELRQLKREVEGRLMPERDSWEKVEKDAGLKPRGYVDLVLGWDMSKNHSENQARSAMMHDIVRRAKALAERERGE